MWNPHVTVATVVASEGRFLMVREQKARGLVLNQPAGHLEPGESLVQAAARECLEETGWRVAPARYLGVCQYLAPDGVCFIRHVFSAHAIEQTNHALDQDIIEAVWLTKEQIWDEQASWRSPMVGHAIEQHLRGQYIDIDSLWMSY